MKKNSILESLLKKLMEQRIRLTRELADMDYNNTNSADKKMTIETQIINLDSQVITLITQLS